MEKCQKGSSSLACNAADSVDFPELDAPLTKMILPDKYLPPITYESSGTISSFSSPRLWREHQQFADWFVADGRIELRPGVTCQEHARSGACGVIFLEHPGQ